MFLSIYLCIYVIIYLGIYLFRYLSIYLSKHFGEQYLLLQSDYGSDSFYTEIKCISIFQKKIWREKEHRPSKLLELTDY